MVKLSQKDLKEKSDFFYSYMGSKKNNASLSEVDPNANVNIKNIATFGAEFHKDINIQINRYILGERIEKLFSKEDRAEYLRSTDNHECYSHDLSSSGIRPYCVAIDSYPFIMEGNIPIGGSSKAPKHLASFCGVYVNLIFLIASQYNGACLYKDQKIIIREGGKTFAVSIQNLVERFELTRSFSYDKSIYNVGSVNNDIEVYEDGKFVKVRNVFKRDYKDTIYKIETASGKVVHTSKDHRFKVFYRGRDVEVKAQDLKVGDTVYNTYNKMNFIDKSSFDYKLGQLLGIVVGDGNIRDECTRISINYKDKHIIDFLNDFCPQFFGNSFVGTLSEGNRCYTYYVGASQVSNKLYEYISGNFFYDKNIDVKKYCLETQLGFLDGLLATDGSYNNSLSLNQSNEELTKTVQEILSNVNIFVDYRSVAVKGNRKPSWSITIPMKICKFLTLTLERSNRNEKFKNALKEDRSYLGDNFSKRNNNKSRCTSFARVNQVVVEDVGFDYISNISVFENNDNFVYEIETESHWYSAGNIITHNCADVSLLNFFDYFARKDYGEDYLNTHKKQIENYLQQLIYTLNDPSVGRGNQAVFYNTSIFDEHYFKALFGDMVYPDFTSPKWESVNKLQKFFMRWFNQERTKAILTFPVITAAGLTGEDGTFKDKDFRHFIAKEASEGNSFFIYSSDTPDSLSSCCRLRNNIDMEKKANTFAYTLGGTGIATGSKKVFTLNINRLTQLGKDIKEEVRKLHKYLVAFDDILYEQQKNGMLPVYDAGYISLGKQYLTIGVNGVLEAAEFLGYEISDNKKYKTWLKNLLKAIKEVNKEGAKYYSEKFNRKIMFNTEFVPGESLGVRWAKKDKEDGFKVNRDCYNSYFYKVEDDSLDIFDKANLYSKDILDNLDGGSAYHINLAENPSYEVWEKIIDYMTKVGCNYFCWNVLCTCCEELKCGYINKNTLDYCSKCGSSNVVFGTRIIGYLKKISSFSSARQVEAGLRKYHKTPKE